VERLHAWIRTGKLVEFGTHRGDVVLNMALNLVGGENLAWRERKADSFTVTPLHSGNKRLGYRDSVHYGEEISLGTAVAVSGAAVSPNRGYIMPVVYADCPPDVKNYRKENDGFPHESTADQFFSESQFESYRALGLHSVKQICASLQGKRRTAHMEEEARTIFQLFQGAANYLQEAKSAQLTSDEAVNFLKKHKPRTAPL